jgi:hypothetical protein
MVSPGAYFRDNAKIFSKRIKNSFFKFIIMGKIKTGLRLICIFALLLSVAIVYANNNPCPVQVNKKLSTKQTVVNIYTAEIGVRELTGHNDGMRVIEYLKAAHLTKGNPWCAAFITWSYKQANVTTVISGYSPTWFPNSNTIYTRGSATNRIPDRADVFGIWFNSKNRIAHVGFIDDWPATNSYCITVEGNTNDAGSREGDGVYKKRRLKSQIYKVSRWI